VIIAYRPAVTANRVATSRNTCASGSVWVILYGVVIMKKLLILFGLNNLFLSFITGAVFIQQERIEFTLPSALLVSIFVVFVITAIGFPLKNQFAWSANFIFSVALVVSVLYITFASMEYVVSNIPRSSILEFGLRIAVLYVVSGVAFFSIIRTVRQDFIQLMRITPIQKWVTVIAGSMIAVTLGWRFLHTWAIIHA